MAKMELTEVQAKLDAALKEKAASQKVKTPAGEKSLTYRVVEPLSNGEQLLVSWGGRHAIGSFRGREAAVSYCDATAASAECRHLGGTAQFNRW